MKPNTHELVGDTRQRKEALTRGIGVERGSRMRERQELQDCEFGDLACPPQLLVASAQRVLTHAVHGDTSCSISTVLRILALLPALSRALRSETLQVVRVGVRARGAQRLCLCGGVRGGVGGGEEVHRGRGRLPLQEQRCAVASEECASAGGVRGRGGLVQQGEGVHEREGCGVEVVQRFVSLCVHEWLVEDAEDCWRLRC